MPDSDHDFVLLFIETFNQLPNSPQDTFSDPEEAYRMLQATLLEISANLKYQ
jgi:hypothetical protein